MLARTETTSSTLWVTYEIVSGAKRICNPVRYRQQKPVTPPIGIPFVSSSPHMDS